MIQMKWDWRQKQCKRQTSQECQSADIFELSDVEDVCETKRLQILIDELETEQSNIDANNQIDVASDNQSSDGTHVNYATETNDESEIVQVPSCSNSRPAPHLKCQRCEYVAENMKSFETHMLTHANNKLRCNRCSRHFVTSQSLKQHKITHKSKKFPYVCCGCFRRFSKASEKLAHDKQCKKRQFQCYLCENVSYFQKERLITHMILHTGVKPFQCNICEKFFTTQNYLRRHLNNIHYEKYRRNQI